MITMAVPALVRFFSFVASRFSSDRSLAVA
jgi:hypothetical protein